MKNISDFFSTICVLFIAGAVVYGGIKEGHAVQTFLILGVVIFLLYLFGVREDNKAKQIQENVEKENRKRYDEKFENFKYKMYHFAHTNERLSKVTYDIEEGGDYLSEYDKIVCRRIDEIIKKHVQYPKDNFEYMSTKIQKEILELQKQTKEKYIGF
jgi:hypothetical protein